MAVYGCRKTRARSSARGRDPAGIRPRPGDERHAGIGSPRRAPRRDVRHRQAGEGRGRRARPRGTRVRGGGARTGRTWPASPACAWPTARSAARRSPPTCSPACSPAGSPAGRAPPPWTPGGGWCRGRRNRRHHGPPRMAAWTVSRTVPAMARGASASCTPPGSGNAACLPRPHGRRPVRQRHGRGRRRRVQDRARPAAQALPGSEGPGAGDVPAGLVARTRSVRTSPRATGHRNGPKPGITRTKRRKPPHYKSGTKTGHITRVVREHAPSDRPRPRSRGPPSPRRRS